MGRQSDKLIQRTLWLDFIEGGGVLVALPFLMFPTVMPVMTFLCLIGLCVIWIITTVVFRSAWPETPFNGVMLLFVMMIGVGVSVSAFPEWSIPKASGLILGIAVWRFLTFATTNPARLRWAVIGFILLCAGMTVIGIFSTDWPTEVPILRSVFSFLPDRLFTLPETPSTKHANQLGGAILIYYPLAISALISAWNARRRWYSIVGLSAVTALITLMIILTQSRSTWISAVMSIFTLLTIWANLLPSSRKRRLLWVLAAGMILIGIAGALIAGPDRLFELFLEPTGMTAFGTLDTLAFRQEVWRWALTAISDFPFTGCGLGAFRRMVTLLYPLNVQIPDISHAHNIFLQVALDIGIPGLIAYLALLGLMVKEAWQVAQREKYRALAIGIMCGMLALHAFGLLDALALGSKPAVAFWYSLGLLSALFRVNHEDGKVDAECGNAQEIGDLEGADGYI